MSAARPARSFFPFIRPSVPPPEEWLEYLAPSYDARRFSNFGPAATRFESELERRYGTGGRRVVTVSSATAGLVAALLALDVQGAVAMPSFTFPATAAAVRLAGCTPRFIDVTPDRWELDPNHLDELLRSGQIGGVVHVRTFGFCRSLDLIEQIAAAHEVPLIVDAAASLGGREAGGRWIGGRGDAEVVSMHATKVFGVGEGGAVFVREDRHARLRRVINFGLDRGVARELGFNGKLSEVQAAIGLAVLERIDAFVRRRSRIAHAYGAGLDDAVEHGHDVGEPPWQAYPVALPVDATAAVERLLGAGVEARRYYAPPLHRTPAHAQASELPVTDGLSARMLCLPIYSDMTDDEVDHVIEIACSVLAPTTGTVRGVDGR